MKTVDWDFDELQKMVPLEIALEVDTEIAISNCIATLMEQRGLNKVGLAKALGKALGKRPCEVTKWLSGQHNFTIRTLAMLSAYFGESLVAVK